MSSRTRSASYSAPSSSSMRDHTERRTHRGKRAKEIVCETCGKVYKHPVCLQKHRWEHTPLWRDTAQLLLSKHQQVQVMEAAAILVHGASLPTDRALWPSYTSGGKLAEPRLSEDGTIRKDHRRHSPALTISSTAARDEPPTEMSDGEELEEVSEEELEDDVGGEQLQEEEVEAEAEDETDESNLPVPIPPSAATPNQTGPRARSHSLAAPLQSHMPNVYGVGYAWSLIGENGQHGYATRSPTEANASLAKPPRSPMAIPTGDPTQLRSPLMSQTHPHQHPPQSRHQHGHHTSLSSFGSFTSSTSSFIPFGSASTSSYIPSSSVRSGGGGGGDWQDQDESSAYDPEAMDMDDDTFAYGSRASSLYKRLATVSGNVPHTNGNLGTPGKSQSRERRREEAMYEMDFD